MEAFESHLCKERGREGFEKEDNINDWEFSLKALKWWERKADEIRNVSI